MSDVNMPKLSDTMEEGTVLEWKKEDGAQVRRGEVLAEVESDKASFEIEAEADGVLHIVVDTGTPVPVGDLIARIGDDGAPSRPAAAEPGEVRKEAPTGEEAEAKVEAPSRKRTEEEAPPGEEAEPQPSAPAEPAAAPSAAEASGREDRPEAPAAEDGQRLKASPLARRLAGQMGVDISTLKGSGPDGRIVKEDVLAAAGRTGAGRPTAPEARPTRPARPAATGVEIVEPNRMQATIARRMVESTTTVPHFYLTVEARVDDVVSLRQQLKENVSNAGRVTMTDFITRACAIALTRFPEVNASWVDGRFQRKNAVNIGLAVPPAEGLGLLVPVVHDVDRKDLVQISIETRQVIERARSGRPAPGDLEGGTFSISNLGMYGVDEFTAIVNPPEAAILAVGRIADVPVVENGQLVPGKVMRLTLSTDHRVFYGVTAARFMAEVKKLIESPAVLLLPPDQV